MTRSEIKHFYFTIKLDIRFSSGFINSNSNSKFTYLLFSSLHSIHLPTYSPSYIPKNTSIKDPISNCYLHYSSSLFILPVSLILTIKCSKTDNKNPFRLKKCSNVSSPNHTNNSNVKINHKK